jgi:hypothetical protein
VRAREREREREENNEEKEERVTRRLKFLLGDGLGGRVGSSVGTVLTRPEKSDKSMGPLCFRLRSPSIAYYSSCSRARAFHVHEFYFIGQSRLPLLLLS